MEADHSPRIIIPTTEMTVLDPSWSEEQRAFRLWLDKHLAGQEEAKHAITEVLGDIRNPLRDPELPVASFMLAGPSRTGKTEIFKLLVEWVNGDKRFMRFFSGTDYKSDHQIQNMLGSPHGYLGFKDKSDPRYRAPEKGEHDETALLSQHNLDNSIIGAKSPFIFLLFDEWEKFHRMFNEFILRPLGEGTGQLNNGDPVSFRNVVIGFTTNIGSRELERVIRGYGFTGGDRKAAEDVSEIRKIVVDEVNAYVPQEFRNRIERLIVFRSLREDETTQLLDTQLDKFRKRVEGRPLHQQFSFEVTPEAKAFIISKSGVVEGVDTKNGVPKMVEQMNRYIVTPLGQLVDTTTYKDPADAALKKRKANSIGFGDRITISYKGGDKLVLEKVSIEGGFDLLTFVKPADTTAASVAATDSVNVPSRGGEQSSAIPECFAPESLVKLSDLLKRSEEPEDKAAARKTDLPAISASAIMQRWMIEGEFGEELIAGREAVYAALARFKEQGCKLTADTSDHENGTFSASAEAPVEVMLAIKDDLQKLRVRIYGGAL